MVKPLLPRVEVFSVETLTGATPSWKTELNKSISAMEDGISRGLQHRHITCCEKGGRRRRQACRVQRWHHRGDVVFWTGGLVYDIEQWEELSNIKD